MQCAASTHMQVGGTARPQVQRQAQACLAAAAPKQGRALAARQPAQQQRQQAARRSGSGGRLAVHASSVYGSEWSTPKDGYLPVGLAHCYAKNDDGKLVDAFVIEPITAAALECMAAGGKTSFAHVFSMRLGEALQRDRSAFPAEFAEAAFCEDYDIRCDACARTWMRPHPLDNLLDIVPLGQLKSGFNYDTKDKRVLNAEHDVNDDDNIKQDMSIDVYNRTDDVTSKLAAAVAAPGAPGAPVAAPAEAAAAAEEDDMDALLSA